MKVGETFNRRFSCIQDVASASWEEAAGLTALGCRTAKNCDKGSRDMADSMRVAILCENQTRDVQVNFCQPR